jgi:hypothetical protein
MAFVRVKGDKFSHPIATAEVFRHNMLAMALSVANPPVVPFKECEATRPEPMCPCGEYRINWLDRGGDNG